MFTIKRLYLFLRHLYSIDARNYLSGFSRSDARNGETTISKEPNQPYQMITGTTQLHCIDNFGFTNKNDTWGEMKELKLGGCYTLDQLYNSQKSVSLKELPGRTFLLSRFIIVDHVDISELTQILEN